MTAGLGGSRRTRSQDDSPQNQRRYRRDTQGFPHGSLPIQAFVPIADHRTRESAGPPPIAEHCSPAAPRSARPSQVPGRCPGQRPCRALAGKPAGLPPAVAQGTLRPAFHRPRVRKGLSRSLPRQHAVQVGPDKDPDGINSLDCGHGLRSRERARYVPDRTSPRGQSRSLTDYPSAHPQVSQHTGGGRAAPLTPQADSPKLSAQSWPHGTYVGCGAVVDRGRKRHRR